MTLTVSPSTTTGIPSASPAAAAKLGLESALLTVEEIEADNAATPVGPETLSASVTTSKLTAQEYSKRRRRRSSVAVIMKLRMLLKSKFAEVAIVFFRFAVSDEVGGAIAAI